MRKLLIGAAIAALSANAMAGIANDIPSCYAANKITPAQANSDAELFVLIDQTTLLDDSLKTSVMENAGNLIRPGNAFTIATFSAFSQGRYLEVLSAGVLEKQIPGKVRDDTSVKLLKNFDACMAGQVKFGRQAAANALLKGVAGARGDLGKSDILSSLKDASSRIKQSTAKEKIVLIVSDMLENSSHVSFYSGQDVRMLDAASEFKKIEAAKVIGDFGGARVYVLGAGLINTSKKDTYRNPKAISALKQFWESWLTASAAQLTEFGTPALLSPVR